MPSLLQGAFGTTNWLDGWSFVNGQGGFVSSTYSCPTAAEQSTPVSLCPAGAASMDITTDTTWQPGRIYVMTCQIFVKSGATLTIGAGVTVYSSQVTIASPMIGGANGVAPALVVEQGGKILADGTATAPITFTALNPEVTSSSSLTTDTSAGSSTVQETRGKWGGLIILGNAPTSAASYTTNYIEGVSGKPYGGTDPADSSGILRYVRVWHGGAVVGANNEINGITFGGVGTGTTVDHCEVAFNADDGFEFFGGTVNVKYLSVLFGGDDSFDTDEGYQGKGQYLFTMLGNQGNHGTEMNAHTSASNANAQPRSHPQFYSMTVIGGGSAGRTGGLMRVRGGSGGKFGNVVLAHATDKGLRNDGCGSETRTARLPASTVSIGTVADGASSGYLYFSPSNIISGATTPIDDDCTPSSSPFSSVSTDPGFTSLSASCLDYTCLTATFNPLPAITGAACTSPSEAGPDSFFDTPNCKGAFASSAPASNWLLGWSWLDCSGKMAGGTCAGVGTSPFADLSTSPVALGGDLTSSATLTASTSYLLGESTSRRPVTLVGPSVDVCALLMLCACSHPCSVPALCQVGRHAHDPGWHLHLRAACGGWWRRARHCR